MSEDIKQGKKLVMLREAFDGPLCTFELRFLDKVIEHYFGGAEVEKDCPSDPYCIEVYIDGRDNGARELYLDEVRMFDTSQLE